MIPIIYRVAFPFLLLSIIALIEAVVQYRLWKKEKQRAKKQPVRNKHKVITLFCLAAFVGLTSYSIYLSQDAILQDYVVCEGVYIRGFRSVRSFGVWDVDFEIDEKTKRLNLLNSTEDIQNLTPNKSYTVTYGKRTNMVISVRSADT